MNGTNEMWTVGDDGERWCATGPWRTTEAEAQRDALKAQASTLNDEQPCTRCGLCRPRGVRVRRDCVDGAPCGYAAETPAAAPSGNGSLRDAWTRLLTEIATRIPNHLKSTQFYEAINDVEGGVREAERSRPEATHPCWHCGKPGVSSAVLTCGDLACAVARERGEVGHRETSAATTTPRRPDLDEVEEYVTRRNRAAIADGNVEAHAAYTLVLDFVRNARFDVPRTSPGRESPRAARLDADGTAKPLTEIVGVFPFGKKGFYDNAEALIARPTKETDDEERGTRRVRQVAGGGPGRDPVGGAVGGASPALGGGDLGGDGGSLPEEPPRREVASPNASVAPFRIGQKVRLIGNVLIEFRGAVGFVTDTRDGAEVRVQVLDQEPWWFFARNVEAVESSDSSSQAWDRRPPALRSTPSKMHAWLSAFAMRDDAPDHLAELLDLTTKNTIDLCVAAIRARAEYMKRSGYVDNTIFGVRNVALWLESEAGIETMAALDDAATDGSSATPVKP